MMLFRSPCRSLWITCLLAGSLLTPAAWCYDLHDNAILHTEEGIVLMERERYLEAAASFQAALRLNPYSAMSASIYNNLGLAFQKAQKYDLALASFQHAIRIQPNYELYYKNLIETYQAADRLSALETRLSQIYQRNPKNGEALFMLGLIAESQGNTKTAKALFSRFLELEPHSTLAEAAQKHL